MSTFEIASLAISSISLVTAIINAYLSRKDPPNKSQKEKDNKPDSSLDILMKAKY